MGVGRNIVPGWIWADNTLKTYACAHLMNSLDSTYSQLSDLEKEKFIIWMHYTSAFTDRIGHCRVHGCRPNENNNPDGCKKFRRKV